MRLLRCGGFLKPTTNVPPGYPKYQNVYFSSKFVKSGGLQIKVGDRFEFLLGIKDKSKPMAFRMNLTEPVLRPINEIQQLIEDMSFNLGG